MKNSQSAGKSSQEIKKGPSLELSVELLFKDLNLHLRNYVDALKSVSTKEQHSS